MDVQSQGSAGLSNSPENTGGQGSSGAQAGGEVGNFKDLFERSQGQLKETQDKVSQLERHFSSTAKQNKDLSSKLDRMKSALMGEEANTQQLSPVQEEIQSLEQEMDKIIQITIEAEREGRPIPLTANTALQGLKWRIQSLQESEKRQARDKALEEKIKELENPSRSIDQTAYSNIDSDIISSLTTIYGPEHDVRPQYGAIAEQISAEIRELRENEPETWDRIRRDRSAQQKMVRYFVEKSIPPRARQLMQEDQIRKTPLTGDEVLSAFREAQELMRKDPQNPQHRRHVAQLREELLTRVFSRNMPGAGQRISNLY